MTKQPKVVKSSAGQTWLLQGFEIFKKQPLIWIFSLFAYFTAMFVFGLIPIFGLVITLILSPGLAFGFIALARAVDEDQIPLPKLIISGFLGNHAKSMLFLGVIYILQILVVLFLSLTIDGGSFFKVITTGEFPNYSNNAQTQPSNFGAIAAVLTYIPVMMSFWYAPQLVVWNNYSATKAIFYSFFAVWINRKSFLFYGLTWLIILIFSILIFSTLANQFDAFKQLLAIAIMPLSLILMAIAHCSYYASTKAVFMNSEKQN
tara:strand:- start:123 stop:905 length:783 start_codon:yes stop_codon:yes gene_type:complete